MEPNEKSEYYFTNRFALMMLEALEEITGNNGMNAILNLANLPGLINNFPADNLAKEFNFADFSAINQAIEEMYGPRGGRGLAMQAGRATFDRAIKNFGALAGTSDDEFKELPTKVKVHIGLTAMAKIFTQLSDQDSSVDEHDDDLSYTIYHCPNCWSRTTQDKPICFMIVGLLQEALIWFSGGNEFRVNESKCIAMGDDVCEFVIQKTSIR